MVSGVVAVGVEALVTELVFAGLEIVQGQLGVGGLEPISTTAGKLLQERGVVGTVDQGIVLFHERMAKGRPHLGRILRLADRRAGRLPRARLNVRAQLVKAGLAKRATRATKAGPIGRLVAMSDAEVLKALQSPLLSKRTKDTIRAQQATRRKIKARR